MMPSDSTSSIPITFRTTVSENIEDPVSGELMTRAVTLFPCGHIFNEDTVIQCLARNKLCPLDRTLIERHAPNYTVRHLAETAESHPLEEIKHEPSEEAVNHFLRGKELAEKGEHATAIEALLQALQLTPTYEKAQAYLEFCLKRSSEASSSLQSLPLAFSDKEKGKEKSLPSADSYKERYIELLFSLLEEPSIQKHSTLKKMLENQLEELMNQDSEELTQKDKLSYKWTEKLLGENKKIRQFAVEKLRQIYQSSSSLIPTAPQSSISTSSSSITSINEIPPLSMTSLYNAIIQVHFPEGNRDFIEQARILDKIYEIEPNLNLSVEEKIPYIFQKLFTLAASLSPLGCEKDSKESKAFTLSNYSSYLLNINRLLLWQKLPGGTEYLDQPQIKALPLKKKGELLTRWIEENGKTITYLILSSLGLNFLPPGQLTKLETLDLSFNQLTAIPEEIGQLSQLQQLYLFHNQLTVIPAEIWQLSQLKTLHLSDNQLTAIPAGIGQLSQLKALYLSNNQLTAIPKEMWLLTRLQGLNLSRNQLTSLPAEIGQLSKLQVLSLFGNQLTAIPAEIGQLTRLQELNLSRNQLTAIPKEMWLLTRLQRLNLSNSHLTVIPAAIWQLSQLRWLDLSSNQLTAIPAAIGQLTKLECLDLNNNQLTAIPAEIGQLPQLRVLRTERNRF
ncbi:leucine-rich repeat domain-containing protein [Neochlamydia sp. AcF84]|uniref:leucine-rich repeat domain-containing protein n=1 Tax=Neochlamydia sp. AcF84 TaxID=2315858 RepID=UPI00140E63FB|nr:leucine-rich repeat domain-containing protein [Neochlamydia sp. AcF84]